MLMATKDITKRQDHFNSRFIKQKENVILHKSKDFLKEKGITLFYHKIAAAFEARLPCKFIKI